MRQPLLLAAPDLDLVVVAVMAVCSRQGCLRLRPRQAGGPSPALTAWELDPTPTSGRKWSRQGWGTWMKRQ